MYFYSIVLMVAFFSCIKLPDDCGPALSVLSRPPFISHINLTNGTENPIHNIALEMCPQKSPCHKQIGEIPPWETYILKFECTYIATPWKISYDLPYQRQSLRNSMTIFDTKKQSSTADAKIHIPRIPPQKIYTIIIRQKTDSGENSSLTAQYGTGVTIR